SGPARSSTPPVAGGSLHGCNNVQLLKEIAAYKTEAEQLKQSLLGLGGLWLVDKSKATPKEARAAFRQQLAVGMRYLDKREAGQALVNELYNDSK
ncbi:hypothetical protein KEM52_004655, partial [Ascosphaera acerosa]